MLISDKQKKILTQLADGKFHSGSQLAETLGISRAAIWKQLQGLAELGVQHIAIRGKGYRLEQPLTLLVAEKIKAALNAKTQRLISTLEIHDHIESTNSYLMACAQHNAPSGTVCFAEYQTAGKGRRGRHWVSPYGHNIYVSILWRFHNSGPAAIAGLSLAIGVAVIRALSAHNIDDIGLKWPNDIYYQGKKLGGILVEVSGETEGPCYAVIGLGLNLFLPATDAKTITQAWTDLSKINPHHALLRNELSGSLLNHILAVVDEYETVGINAYLEEWRSYDCLKHQSATLFIGKHAIEGMVKGIDDNGLLLLQLADGSIQAFASGEVSFNQAVL